MAKDKPEAPRKAKPPRAPRRSAKLSDLEAVEQKLADRDVRIADIGKIADQVKDMFTNTDPTSAYSTDIENALVKIEAILALVRGEDLGEWARARIGL